MKQLCVVLLMVLPVMSICQQFAQKEKLTGVMIREISQDTNENGSILEAVNGTIGKE